MLIAYPLYLKECFCALNNAVITEHFLEKQPPNLLFQRLSVNLCHKGEKLFVTVKNLFSKNDLVRSWEITAFSATGLVLCATSAMNKYSDI